MTKPHTVVTKKITRQSTLALTSALKSPKRPGSETGQASPTLARTVSIGPKQNAEASVTDLASTMAHIVSSSSKQIDHAGTKAIRCSKRRSKRPCLDGNECSVKTEKYSREDSAEKVVNTRNRNKRRGKNERPPLDETKLRRSKRLKHHNSSFVTPNHPTSPGPRHNDDRALSTGIVVDLHMAHEEYDDSNVSENASRFSARSIGSLGAERSSSVTSGSTTELLLEHLAAEARCICCPFLVSRSLRSRSVAPETHKCTCESRTNDNDSKSHLEKYLATYSMEYLCFLNDNELNLDHLGQNELPPHLTDPSSSSSLASTSTMSTCIDSPSTKTPPRSTSLPTQRRRSPRLMKNDNSSAGYIEDARASKDESKTKSTIAKRDSRSAFGSMSSSTTSSSTTGLTLDRYSWYMSYLERKKRISGHMRSLLVDWLIEIAEEYKVGSVTIQTAVGLVDRSLAGCRIVKDVKKVKNASKKLFGDNTSSKCSSAASDVEFGSREAPVLLVDRNTVQLLGCGCILIACKLHEVAPPKVKELCCLTAGSYKPKELREMELGICALLSFSIQIITPHHFASIYLRASFVSSISVGIPACAFQDDDIMVFMVDYILEIALLQPVLVPERPSKVAAAAIYLARANLGIRDLSDPVDSQGFFSKMLKWYSGYDMGDLFEVVFILHEAYKNAPDEELTSVYEKYQEKKRKEVALLAPIDDELLMNSFTLV